MRPAAEAKRRALFREVTARPGRSRGGPRRRGDPTGRIRGPRRRVPGSSRRKKALREEVEDREKCCVENKRSGRR